MCCTMKERIFTSWAKEKVERSNSFPPITVQAPAFQCQQYRWSLPAPSWCSHHGHPHNRRAHSHFGRDSYARARAQPEPASPSSLPSLASTWIAIGRARQKGRPQCLPPRQQSGFEPGFPVPGLPRTPAPPLPYGRAGRWNCPGAIRRGTLCGTDGRSAAVPGGCHPSHSPPSTQHRSPPQVAASLPRNSSPGSTQAPARQPLAAARSGSCFTSSTHEGKERNKRQMS